MAAKTCTGRCQRERPLDDFPRDRTKRDGRGARCRECRAVDRRERRRQVSRERIADALAADDPGRRRMAAANLEFLSPPVDPEAPARAARIVALANAALRRHSGPLAASEASGQGSTPRMT